MTDRKKIVTDTLRAHPDADNRTLARLLNTQYPHEFETVERARDSVRYYRGVVGSKKRAKKSDRDLIQPPRSPRTIKLPKGIRHAPPRRRFNDEGKWLLMGDLHCPFHDEGAIEAAIKYGRDNGIKHLCLNGDIYDFYKLSRWTKNPRERDPDHELDIGGQVLDELARHFPGRKVFKAGNHEERYETYLFAQAPALVGIADFELHKVLRLKERGYDYVKSRQFYSLGRLSIFHGHELPRGLTDPVNVARGVYNRVRESAIVNHWHRTSAHVDSTGLKTHTVTCYSNGCMCDMQPNYAPINAWNRGFAEVTVAKGGEWGVQTKLIDRGQVYAVG